jgi:hypothetical protein
MLQTSALSCKAHAACAFGAAAHALHSPEQPTLGSDCSTHLPTHDF